MPEQNNNNQQQTQGMSTVTKITLGLTALGTLGGLGIQAIGEIARTQVYTKVLTEAVKNGIKML